MEKANQKPHAVMIPYPLQGHIIPFANLAVQLATSHSFTITFVNTEVNHLRISRANDGQEDIFASARSSGIDVRYATVSDGFPIEFDRSLQHSRFLEELLVSFESRIDQLIGRLIQEDPSINTLITDTFYVWTSRLARKYGLASVSFFTEPALVLTIYYHSDLLKKHGHFGSEENRKDPIDYIPGVKSILPTDLMSFYQEREIVSVIEHKILAIAFLDAQLLDFILCNTIQELEEEAVSALEKKQPFYAIGPIFPPGFTKSIISTSLWSESNCTQWLNSKPRGSVLYVSFGSYAHATKREVEELAHGLLLSEVNFLLVVRSDIVSSDEPDFLPPGFVDRAAERGLLVEWCSQIQVISHPSVGGFLTHCGWNSILESVHVGVPMICYPLLTDQFTNRRLVVDDWKVGVNLRDEKILTREEVAAKIRFLMEEKTSKKIREKMQTVRGILKAATADVGSSAANIARFVEDLKAKIAVNAQKNKFQENNISY